MTTEEDDRERKSRRARSLLGAAGVRAIAKKAPVRPRLGVAPRLPNADGLARKKPGLGGSTPKAPAGGPGPLRLPSIAPASPSAQARAGFNTPKRPRLPSHHPAMQAQRQQNGQASQADQYGLTQEWPGADAPTEQPNINLGPINKMAEAGTEAIKDIGKDVAKEALKSAAKGALKGGVHGAAAGAVSGIAKGLAKNPTSRNLIIGALLICLITPIISFFTTNMMISMTSASVSAADTTSMQKSAVASGVSDKDIRAAVDYTDGSNIPWPIAAAYKHQQGKDLDLKAMLAQLDKADPKGNRRNLTAGSVYNSDSLARSTGVSSDSKDAAAAVAKTWKTALQGLGLSESDANAVFQAAMVWALGQINGCGTTATGGPGALPSLTDEQTHNAAVIMGMAKTYFPGNEVVQQKAATIAIAIAIEESGLNAKAANGDAYLGLFQQIEAWGTKEQRFDPAYASATFFNTLVRNNPTWASMDQKTLTLQMAKQQFGTGVADNEYQAYADDLVKNTPQAAALVASGFQAAPAVPRPAIKMPVSIDGETPGGDVQDSPVTCTSGGTVVDGTSQQIAQAIMPYIQAGAVSYYEPHYYGDQIPNIANGTATANCVLAPNILRVVLAALQKWGTVTINDLNRKCYGSKINNGFSPHYQGNAIDFGAVGGHATKGPDTWSIQLIRLADQYLPPGAGVGQSDCSRAHIDGLKNITRQFEDECSHQHIDNGGNAGAIKGTF